MIEAEWLACTDAAESWTPLRGHVSERKHRLFVCACCRLWQHSLSAAILEALEVAERAADELIGWRVVRVIRNDGERFDPGR